MSTDWNNLKPEEIEQELLKKFNYGKGEFEKMEMDLLMKDYFKKLPYSDPIFKAFVTVAMWKKGAKRI